jgi:hypothetical protein
MPHPLHPRPLLITFQWPRPRLLIERGVYFCILWWKARLQNETGIIGDRLQLENIRYTSFTVIPSLVSTPLSLQYTLPWQYTFFTAIPSLVSTYLSVQYPPLSVHIFQCKTLPCQYTSFSAIPSLVSTRLSVQYLPLCKVHIIGSNKFLM